MFFVKLCVVIFTFYFERRTQKTPLVTALALLYFYASHFTSNQNHMFWYHKFEKNNKYTEYAI